MWRELKNLILEKPQNEIQSVICNGNEICDKKEIANELNNFFIQSVKDINESIDNKTYINQIERTNAKFKFRLVTIDELKRICKELKNKSDFDRVSPRIIVDNWNVLGPYLHKLINKSLETGNFPTSWKDSVITPVEKVPKTKKCEEFRPINTLKTVEKILESVVKNQLQEYMENNDLFSKNQSGFRKYHSCETAINYVINEWKNRDTKEIIIALFLDFKRAFETIDIEILLKKLRMYGVEDNEIKWFRAYLTQRRQKTKIGNIESDYANTHTGVPQGSILGALLFIIYINDIENVVKHCKVVMYADDTLLYIKTESIEECKRKINCDIDLINNWLKMNKLKLNEQKTKVMAINSNCDINLSINGKNIEQVKNIKYLGAIIDNELKFYQHVDNMCKKISKKIGFFKRIRNKIDTFTAINIYNTIIKPHFEYCSTLLYTCCNQSQKNRLQKLQNKCMRTIIRCNIYTPVTLMLSILKWLNIEERIKLNTILMIFKIKYGKAPKYFLENVQYVRNAHQYPVRNNNDFRIEFRRTTAAQNTILYRGLNLYNLLPNVIKNETNFTKFRQKCIKFIKNEPIDVDL